MAKKIIDNTPISNFYDDWGGVYTEGENAGKEWGKTHDAVETAIKNKANEHDTAINGIKNQPFNHVRVENVPEDLAHLRMVWENNGTDFANVLIPSGMADSYRAILAIDRTGSSDTSPFLIQQGGNWSVSVRLNAWRYFAADNTRELLPASTNLIIERSLNGINWTLMRSVVINSTDNEQSFTNTINIGPDLNIGTENTMQVRFRIEPIIYESEGEVNYLTATPIVIFVRSINLSLSMPDAQWMQAKVVNSGTQNLNGLEFNLQGNASKTLHLQITNAAGVVRYNNTFSGITTIGEYTVNAEDNSGTLGLTTSGVHGVTAWLTCQSIDGTTLESEHIKHQIVVVNRGDTSGAMNTRVLIQSIAASVDNFVQSDICRYMVWKPKEQDGNIINDTESQVYVRFIVANEIDLDTEHQEYLSLPVNARPGTAYNLVATIESEDGTEAVYLHAVDTEGVSLLSSPQFLSIDNGGNFQPIDGSVFVLNPKMRSNDENNAQSIINSSTSDSAIPTPQSVWSGFKMDESDGWVTDDSGEKVLRIPAGRKLTIQYNPFNWFYTAPSTSKGMTIDIDFSVRNVVNEEDVIFRIAEYQSILGSWLGLMMKPMDGTMVSVNSGAEDGETDFRWAEGRKQHLSISISPNVRINPYNDLQYNKSRNTPSEAANASLNLVRVYLNGVIIREIRFLPGNATEFCTGVLSNGGIIIGQEGQDGRASGADINIYGIRVWHSGLTPAQTLQNYVSSIPDGATKRQVKAQNDILRDDNSGRLSLAKVKGAGKNAMVWHGDMPLIDDDGKKGWFEITRYDNSGVYLPEYSGSFCKTTKKLKSKGQGTTAMSYYYWNMQMKLGDVGWDEGEAVISGETESYDFLVADQCITLTPEQLHSSIVLGTIRQRSSLTELEALTFKEISESFTHVCAVYGGCLGKNYPLQNGTKDYPCTVDGNGDVTSILLPDGWIDGNGLYRGQCWQAGPNQPFAQKLVAKINYASSMQSHLIGANWLFNELHTRYCGENSLQAATPTSEKALVSKHVEPMLLFTAGLNVTDEDQTNSTATYQGPCGMGPGKMDKPTWGYVKKLHPLFAMFEGGVNNSILTDMLAPFDDTDLLDSSDNIVHRAKVKYFFQDPEKPGDAKDPECFYYRKTKVVEVEGEQVVQDDWEKGIELDGGATGRKPSDGALYNNTSCDNPDEAPTAAITAKLRDAWNYLYLHNPNINLYRGTFDDFQQRTFSDKELKQKWVCRANGTDANNYLLKRYDFCERRWVDAGLWNKSLGAYDVIDIRYYEGMNWDEMSVEEQNNHAAVVAKFRSLVIADAKPTENHEGIGQYFKVSSVRFHYAFVNLFIAGTDNCSKNTYYVIDPATGKIELHQDDLDTILATDNFGYQTKPYYIDRMHPYPDGSNVSGYDGMQNGLFDLVEAMWMGDGTIAQTMATVINNIADLTGGLSSPESDAMGNSVWKSLNRYLFDIQRWIPKVAFNEAARIRYEFPAALGYTGREGKARPLAQSMGDQLESEIQFMKRRLVYMASFAGTCEFGIAIGQGRKSSGIEDLGANFPLTIASLPNGAAPSVTFRFVPHQYLYPCVYQNETVMNTNHRVAPGEEYVYVVPNVQVTNDYPLVVPGINYYRSIGNIGDISSTTVVLAGSRMTSFIAEPTLFYPTAGGSPITAEVYEALEDKSGYLPAFRPNVIAWPAAYPANRLQTISLKGCKTIASSASIPLDLSKESGLQSADLRGTSLQKVVLPQTSTLTTLHLPATLVEINLNGLTGLVTISVEGAADVETLIVDDRSALAFNLLSQLIEDQQSDFKLNTASMTNIDWGSVSSTMIMLLESVPNITLTGVIELNSETRLTYEQKFALMRKFGDIDTGDDGLRIIYTYNIRIDIDVNIFCDGVADTIGSVGQYQFQCIPMVALNIEEYASYITKVEWLLAENRYATIDDNGLMTVTQVGTSATQPTVKLVLRVTLLNDSVLTSSLTLNMYDKEIVLGDYVYVDGSYSAVDYKTKTKVGILYIDDNGVKEVCTLANLKSDQWGLYSGNVSGVTTNGSTSAYDTPLPNIGNTNNFTAKDTNANYFDAANDEFVSRAGTAEGDLQVSPAVDTVIDNLIGGNITFEAGKKYPAGYYNTLILMRWRNIILAYGNLGIPQASAGETEKESLDRLISAIIAANSNNNNYREYYFPAASYCHAYEPTVRSYETLHDKFKAHKWFLPAAGELARMMFYWLRTQDETSAISKYNAFKAAKAAGKISFSNDWYWSSTEYNANNAWGVGGGSGVVYHGTDGNKGRSHIVRPVCAF